MTPSRCVGVVLSPRVSSQEAMRAGTVATLRGDAGLPLPDLTMFTGFLAPLRKLMDKRVDRDGEAPSLHAALSDGSGAYDSGPARRDRRLGRPQEILERSLAQKVLHGWIQNRHQVLVPLTLRFGQLRADDVELLMRLAAASLLAASDASGGAKDAVIRWLRSVGAVDDAIVVFDRALRAPSALSTLLEGARARKLEAYAYAVATMAADLRAPSGRLYADFVAARLALPADAVRSINRRFRR